MACMVGSPVFAVLNGMRYLAEVKESFVQTQYKNKFKKNKKKSMHGSYGWHSSFCCTKWDEISRRCKREF